MKKTLMKKILMKKMKYGIFFRKKFRFGATNRRNLCFSFFARSLLKYKKKKFCKNYESFKLGARKFHFPKYVKFFHSIFFLFFKLGLKSVPYSHLVHYYHRIQFLSLYIRKPNFFLYLHTFLTL